MWKGDTVDFLRGNFFNKINSHEKMKQLKNKTCLVQFVLLLIFFIGKINYLLGFKKENSGKIIR